jgi:hypothetical protein
MRTDWENPFAAPTASRRADAVRTLLIASALTIALYFVPYAGFVTYPIRLLVTFIHEGSHALMSLLTGGVVDSISISPDGSGLTMSRLAGWLPSVLVGSAGYLGASLYGASMIALLRRGVSSNRLLLATGIAVALVTLGALKGILWPLSWGHQNVFALFFALGWGVVLALGLVVAARKLDAKWAGWVASFIGVQCVLNSLFDLRTLFALSISTGAPTDARNMENLTLIPAAVWATLWIVLSLGMLLFVLRPSKRPVPAAVRR